MPRPPWEDRNLGIEAAIVELHESRPSGQGAATSRRTASLDGKEYFLIPILAAQMPVRLHAIELTSPGSYTWLFQIDGLSADLEALQTKQKELIEFWLSSRQKTAYQDRDFLLSTDQNSGSHTFLKVGFARGLRKLWCVKLSGR